MTVDERRLLIEELESLGIRTSEITKLDNSELKELAESIKISWLKEYSSQCLAVCDCLA